MYLTLIIYISRLKFAKFEEYFKNKPEAEIVQRIKFRTLKICKYNTMICFYLAI